jgi:hypothetical protein
VPSAQHPDYADPLTAAWLLCDRAQAVSCLQQSANDNQNNTVDALMGMLKFGLMTILRQQGE